MEQPSISKLQFYSLGIVAANKTLSSMSVEITPVEEFPMLDGELTDSKEEYKADTVDNSGAAASTSIDSTTTVKAKWLPINNSNRRSAPDVRRGEKVVLYKFADTDEYWWNTLFNDSKLRRLETVIYAFSDNAAEGVEDTANSTYFLEVSTHRKIMHVHTSKSDGEPFAYDVQINAKDGIVTIADDAGNSFVLNSKDSRLTMENVDGSVLDLNKTVMTLTASDSVEINTSAFKVNADTTTVSGDALVKGSSDLSGGMSVSGGSGASAIISGSVQITGSTNITGHLQATSIDEG